ncbi:hypothetical protein RRG08_036407 [Elysia crispata]|uniref:Uncharacterized protein n=1 Tax=Elysia crispata TaxID=231223 RepID=A0AAE1DHJ1_9GAST|nr:hypothetical protein RRG08_036407 [Elysia crispata]
MTTFAARRLRSHDSEKLIESSERTDSVDLKSGNSPSGCKWVSTPTPVEVNEFREYTGVKFDLPPNAQPKDYFNLFSPPSWHPMHQVIPTLTN